MQDFTTTLYNWYHLNKRDLPWRETDDPYKIWISEIILQQTRVAQGIAYYQRFTEHFPTVHKLASASEDEVLKLWQGLGYYSRARNLHSAARSIVEEYSGIFPNTFDKIIRLKGIGPYTAAAIASIAFSIPKATVDGNVYRVLSRYFGIETPINSNAGKKDFTQMAEELLDKKDPGTFNQALMEFGALQCVPKKPDCKSCPLSESCAALASKSVDRLPVKEKKTKQTERFFYYYLMENGETIYLEKRSENDIWKNLYQLPLVEEPSQLSDTEIMSKPVPFIINGRVNLVAVSERKKHILSHQIIWAWLIRIEILDNTEIRNGLIPVNKKDISKFAVPRLMELFFNEFELNV
ncbi:MAG TPA: A/G-specific adenine glycosylase [Draconibacterium sp.]|nr:A/G-specific adenine glycosylase [Draconibacterium sp.]